MQLDASGVHGFQPLCVIASTLTVTSPWSDCVTVPASTRALSAGSGQLATAAGIGQGASDAASSAARTNAKNRMRFGSPRFDATPVLLVRRTPTARSVILPARRHVIGNLIR